MSQRHNNFRMEVSPCKTGNTASVVCSVNNSDLPKFADVIPEKHIQSYQVMLFLNQDDPAIDTAFIKSISTDIRKKKQWTQ